MAAVLVLGAAPAAAAQLLRGLRGPDLSLPAVGALPGEVVSGVQGQLDPDRLTDLRLIRLRDLLRANRKTLDTDDHGAVVVRGEVLAISPSAHAMRAAEAAGFSVSRRENLAPLDVEEVVLTPPSGLSVRAAVHRLRALDPNGQYDFDHLYSPSGNDGREQPIADGERVTDAPGARAGLIDTGVDSALAVFAATTVRREAFAPGGIKVDAHGDAVASLMVGRLDPFHGAAPGAALFAADVYGPGPTGGSADAIVHALAWMARNNVPVINISLVGPPNLTLEAAVRAVIARGELVVAPVGNDGPTAPPLYPASYPGVVAVTAVDARGRVIFEAGRAKHVDFAAPGADLLAAKPGGGLASVRGTSFASPIVAGRLALLLHRPDRAAAVAAVADLARQATRASGAGHGVVGEDVRLSARAGR